MKPRPALPAPTQSQTSEIGILAEQIRMAADFLVRKHRYSLDELRNISGGGDRKGKGSKKKERLHKNSLMKIKDLRVSYAVQRPKPGGDRTHWVEAPASARNPDGSKGRLQWMWNPQVDTFEKLERILIEARRLGFDTGKAPSTGPLSSAA